MPVLDVPPPAFMQDPDIQMFADSANRFFERAAPVARVVGWREAGQVEMAQHIEIDGAVVLRAARVAKRGVAYGFAAKDR